MHTVTVYCTSNVLEQTWKGWKLWRAKCTYKCSKPDLCCIVLLHRVYTTSWRRSAAWDLVSKAPILHFQRRQSLVYPASHPTIPPPSIPTRGLAQDPPEQTWRVDSCCFSCVCPRSDIAGTRPGLRKFDHQYGKCPYGTRVPYRIVPVNHPPKGQGELTSHQGLLIHSSRGSSQHCRLFDDPYSPSGGTRVPVRYCACITAYQECHRV